ncbi:SF3a splicing factor complex subunit [Serendipita sp. 399]|nr:SF3a splicing factor complex subunit [Serendipita sp. 399]
MAEVLPLPTALPMKPVDEASSNGAPLLKFAASDIILPPPDLKTIIEKTAAHVARSTTREQFEDRLRESRREDPKFSFLIPSDPYHAYYRLRIDKIVAGEDEEGAAAGLKDVPMEEIIETAPVDEGDPPPPMQFALSIPPISAMDVDVMKLTALFTAQRGTQFLASLSVKEGRNYQFDFLRPNSLLYPIFNAMVEQYRNILLPPKEQLSRVKAATEPEGKWERLAEIRRQAKWERIQREKAKQREDDEEAERIAFAEIDWHDFAIVQTIEFTAADTTSELPIPMTLQQMEARALEEKRHLAMVMVDATEEVERAKEAARAIPQQTLTPEVLEAQRRKQSELEEQAREEMRAREVQAKVLEGAGPMKIRHDYVPKTLVEKTAKVQMTTCQICGQQIPADELDEHMRIELLDPKWKSQKELIENRKAQQNELQKGADVAASLKKLARKRVDLFGADETEEVRRREEEEELARRKEREKVVWDGHTASKTGTMDKYQTNVNFDEQIAAIHRAKGLAPVDPNAMGPGIGPAVTPVPISLPAPPTKLMPNPAEMGVNAAFSVPAMPAPQAPQPPTAMYTLAPGQPPPVVLPPLHYQGLGSAQPFGYTPAPPGMHPSRASALAKPAGAVAGTVRTAEEMLEGEPDGGTAMKRPRVGRLPGGELYPEDTWLTYYPEPVTIYVQLPMYADKPEWKLDGSRVTIDDVQMSNLVSTLRERLVTQIDSKVPSSRIKLQMGNATLSNTKTLASYNIMDGELIAFELRDAKKK